jgi:hypothetical protein
MLKTTQENLAIRLLRVATAAAEQMMDLLHPGHLIIEIFRLYQRHGQPGHLVYQRPHWKQKQFSPLEKMTTKSGVMMKEMKASIW